jgi:hypothetical protein
MTSRATRKQYASTAPLSVAADTERSITSGMRASMAIPIAWDRRNQTKLNLKNKPSTNLLKLLIADASLEHALHNFREFGRNRLGSGSLILCNPQSDELVDTRS